jgi:hypothetical protein
MKNTKENEARAVYEKTMITAAASRKEAFLKAEMAYEETKNKALALFKKEKGG